MKIFLQKDPAEFDPKQVNSKLRGNIFFFCDLLLATDHPELTEEGLEKVMTFLSQYIDFIIEYLKIFPKYFNQFMEGVLTPESKVNKADVAYAHFIYEAIEILGRMFGEKKRNLFFFETTAQNFKGWEKFKCEKSIVNEPIFKPPTLPDQVVAAGEADT
mmetsp:Transcript_7112/g.6383  ORF Transcript_7112/g.6383 Transcript_7112/m.6383 type:complete len:159 (+) Transcript_7112:319-795(+)